MVFYQIGREIEANLYKYESVVQLNAPTSKKEVQKLNGMLTALNRFISKSSRHALPFYRLLRNEPEFEGTPKCKRAFESLKKVLVAPSVLTRPLQKKPILIPVNLEEGGKCCHNLRT